MAKVSVKSSQKVKRAQYEDELIDSIIKDFERRQAERLVFERQWELNRNFLNGNQYCDLNSRGEILVDDKSFYWQNRGVYNHIAPIIDTRLAKLSIVSPTIAVRPKTDDDMDVASASLAEKLVESAFKATKLNTIVESATVWSETCGTGFYKILWDANGGNKVGCADGKDVYEGEVNIVTVSPFEIFPDNLYAQSIEDCSSIIHARAMTVESVKEKYGITLLGEKVDITSLCEISAINIKNEQKSVLENAVIVIEKYEKPTKEFPNGRLITVAGGKLLYVGELPYINGENGTRTFPFVKQCSFEKAGCFFGTSVIERLIPVQRAFNAVKNRKHEFMNRLSMGVMTVEDGSIDVDDLAEDGLSPGKVLVYRQGSKAPELMDEMSLPIDFDAEEERLLNEFVIISGVSNVTSSSSNASLSSGTSLEILVEQDNSRLLMTAESIRRSYLEISRQIIRLYAQFSVGLRAVRHQDDFDKIRVYYADKHAVNSDDVYIVNENELLYTPRQKKEMIFKLYNSGLLTDDNGKLRPETKEKVLSLLGYKELDYQKGLARLQQDKAQKENDKLRKQCVSIDEIDDNFVHIDEHTRYVLSEFNTLSEAQKQRFYEHIKLHKQKNIENQLNIKVGE